MIVRMLVVGPISSNCFIAADEKTKAGVIIDPGADAPDILDKVEELGLDIKHILLTHVHFDHVGALAEVKESTKAPIAIHEADAPYLNENAAYGAQFGVRCAEPPPADKLLKGGENIEFGDSRLTVLHTPGHTPGGICLYGEGSVFTGDTLFNFGIGRYDFPGGDLDQLMQSIKTKLMTLPDATKIYPGHGPTSTIGAERRGNPFLNM